MINFYNYASTNCYKLHEFDHSLLPYLKKKHNMLFPIFSKRNNFKLTQDFNLVLLNTFLTSWWLDVVCHEHSIRVTTNANIHEQKVAQLCTNSLF